MKFVDLLHMIGDEPVFSTGLLLAGGVDPNDVRRQLSRWKASGKILQLRRGVYMLGKPYQKTSLHPFLLANLLVKGSYVSLQSALAHYGLIPEYVPVTTSVTTLRPCSWSTPAGSFSFRHLKHSFFHSYRQAEVSARQFAFVATPEKALFDLIYLTPKADSPEYISELRLQNLATLEVSRLMAIGGDRGSPKLQRAALAIRQLQESESRKEGRG